MNVLASILSSLIFILLDCECGNLETISTQDILSNGVNQSDQIIGKFVTLIIECASNFDAYKTIELPIEEFPYHSIFYQVGLSNKTILFQNVSASLMKFDESTYEEIVTSVECDSSGIGEICVSLPRIINIEAEFIIRSRENDFEVKGGFLYQMENNALIRLSNISNNEWNSESNVKHQLVYAASKVKLETDREDHRVIYLNLHSFISSIELSLVNYLAKQLNAELLKRNATFSSFSKFVKPKQPNRLEPTVVSSLVDKKAFLNKLYITPNVKFAEHSSLSFYILQNLKLEFGQIITLDPNLIIVEGLSNFTNVKTTFVWVNPAEFRYFDGKHLIVRIKSGILSGKCSWICCIKANDTEINRNIEFLFKASSAEIEIKIKRLFEWVLGYQPRECPIRNLEVRIHLKKMQIKTKLPNAYCENMSKSVQNVLNNYLELAIGESLKESIRKKIHNTQFDDDKFCMFFVDQ